jgi:hypothetical protein
MPDNAELTPVERAVLLVLMAEGRAVGNTELSEKHGFKIDRATRDGMGKLLDVTRVGSAYMHQVSEPGWARGGAELAADFEVPARPTKAQVAAWKALAKVVKRYLDATGMKPSEFFDPQPASGIHADTHEPASAGLQSHVQDAYRDIAEYPRQSVALSELRARLDGFDKAEIDAALVEMFSRRLISLTPGANQKTRTKAVERAAVEAGGELKHYMSMEA